MIDFPCRLLRVNVIRRRELGDACGAKLDTLCGRVVVIHAKQIEITATIYLSGVHQRCLCSVDNLCTQSLDFDAIEAYCIMIRQFPLVPAKRFFPKVCKQR